MSWFPAMMLMHILNNDEPYPPQNPPDPVEQYSTGCNAGNTPVVNEMHEMQIPENDTKALFATIICVVIAVLIPNVILVLLSMLH